ncbi:MAG: hypothetical protein DSM107014_05420 [Gomphosphaeria aponina SAG 52.96 = DSM 107014]|uniref:Uncharacterized protein n=1 Tax=Gomphosphaeria aponina SAG 52.96 = DSM 107014 TaxID=1521640 RepID=A0A941JRS2_9CHRO|nr:hypothetical protein [Gomphosphaeria aponina SAG 52.96 = DSM 107014]
MKIDLQKEGKNEPERIIRRKKAEENMELVREKLQKQIAKKAEQPAWVYHKYGDALLENGQVKEAIAAYEIGKVKKFVNEKRIRNIGML